MKFEILRKGVMVDGVELEIGAIVEAPELPAWLAGKAVAVEEVEVPSLEVATPRRGRPPKEQSAE